MLLLLSKEQAAKKKDRYNRETYFFHALLKELDLYNHFVADPNLN